MNSIDLLLWEAIEKETGTDGDGLLVFAHIVSKLQQVSASAIRSLVQKLEAKPLALVPGHDMETLSNKLNELCRKMKGAGILPPNLASLVARTLLQTDVLEFNVEASTIHNSLDRDITAMLWQEVITQNKRKY